MNGSLLGSENAFIATQGPLDNTIGDFWQMVWQYDVTNIIMLCDFCDLGKPRCSK